MTPPLARFLAFAAWLSFASLAGAADVLLLTPSGASILTLDESGRPTITELGKLSVIDLRGNSGEGGSPPPDPEPRPPAEAPDQDLAEKSARWADHEADPAGAGIMSMIYWQVADAVKSGELIPGQASVAARLAADDLVDGWQTFRERVGAAAAERLSAGGLTTGKEMADFLYSVSIGLKSRASAVEPADAINATRSINAAIDAAKG